MIRGSGRSSPALLQSVPLSGAALHQDLAVYLAVCGEALGGVGARRVHGGGFTGTIQAFVPLAAIQPFRSRVESISGNACCTGLSVYATDYATPDGTCIRDYYAVNNVFMAQYTTKNQRI